MHTPGGGAGSGRGDTLGAVVGGPRGTAEVKAQRVLEGTPLGWAGGSGLQQQGGGSPQQRRRRMKAGDDGLAGSARRLLGVFPANSWLTPRRLGRERIPHPRQPPGAGTAGRDHGAARHSSAATRQPSLGHRAAGTRATPTSPIMPCPHRHQPVPRVIARAAVPGDTCCSRAQPRTDRRRPGGSLPRGWSRGHAMAREGAVPAARGTGPSTFSHARREP